MKLSKTDGCFLLVEDVFEACLNKNIDLSLINFGVSQNSAFLGEIDAPCINELDLTKKIEIDLIRRFDFVAEELKRGSIHDTLKDQIADAVIFFKAAVNLQKRITFRHLASKFIAMCLQNESDFCSILEEAPEKAFRLCDIVFERLVYGYDLRQLHSSFKLFFPDGRIYQRKDKLNELVFFLNHLEDNFSKATISFLTMIFTPFEYSIQVFFDKHFGIIEEDSTMIIDEISIIE